MDTEEKRWIAGRLAPASQVGHHQAVDVRGVTPRPGKGRFLLPGVALLLLGLVGASRWHAASQQGARDDESWGERRSPEPAPSSQLTPASEWASPALGLPSGAPTRIDCDGAQRVAVFLARELAAPPIAPQPAELAEHWAMALDPHGMWSASPDSPVQAELMGASSDMVASFSGGPGHCRGAERVAEIWSRWQGRLLAAYDAAFDAARGRATRVEEVFELSAEPIFEDDPVTRPGLELARELGARFGAFSSRFPEEGLLVEQARARLFPTGKLPLGEIAILAALRAYVPLVDPHGDFAPNDEEWALYAGDGTLDGGSPLWGEVTRTPLGARITDDPAPPLELDDLVLSIDGLTLAGASLDQIEQAARSSSQHDAFALRVLRRGESKILTLRVLAEPREEAAALAVERIRIGRGDEFVLRVEVPDVPDDLDGLLVDVFQKEVPGSRAVLLDLRGNGGGSLDAAVASLGLFLPGAKLFPLVHRGAVTEVLEAPRPALTYGGPLAALVDGDTASAAEMLAGALQAYGRGVVVGARTFGKGCVQEYFDQVVASGVLRMTTLQFVMPNGKPLQQIGLTPDLLLPLAPALERESQITRQPITFDGPDVRDRKEAVGPAWPRYSAPGPCADPVVCSAVSRLAGVRPGGAGGPRAARPRAGVR